MKSRVLIIFIIGMIGFTGISFAEESPSSPIPEPEQEGLEYASCGPGTTYQDGICIVDKIENSTKISTDTFKRWGGSYAYDVESPLKQFKSGIAINEIQCRELLILVTKHDGTPACVKEQSVPKLVERGWSAEFETKKLWKSTDDWNSMNLVRDDDNLYCGSANEELSDQCYSLEEIVFGNGFKRGKYYDWKVYPGEGLFLPENSTITPIYRTSEPLGFLQIDLNAMLDDKIFVNKCESNEGIWNYTYHDCENLWQVCRDVGGIIIQEDVTPPCTDTGIIDDDPLTIKVCGGAGIIRVSCVFEYEN